ncbi:MAG: sensor histidine kinase [Aminipila sp.]
MNVINYKLFHKYTDLKEEEIAYLETYIDKMQMMADQEKADVFIDCKTYTGKTTVIIAEAKPSTVPSAYKENLLGMLIKWENEPALDRTFHLKLPTTGVKALQVPENRNVIQSAFPIIFKEKVIAVLIYEKIIDDENKSNEEETSNLARLESANKEDLLEFIRDAAVLINHRGKICYRNRAAKMLYKNLGYVDDILDMYVGNLWCVSESEDTEVNTLNVSGHTLQGTKIPMHSDEVNYALIIEDITNIVLLEKENNKIKISYKELKHRLKNSLQLVSGIYDEKAAKSNSIEVAQAYKEAAGRLMSVLATLGESRDSFQDEVEIKEMIKGICSTVISAEASPYLSIDFEIKGDQIRVSGEKAVTIGLVVNELIHNALKYAFKNRTEGKILASINKDVISSTIVIEDNGIGFTDDRSSQEFSGLELINIMVSERLDGELIVDTGNSGTKVQFDFIE